MRTWPFVALLLRAWCLAGTPYPDAPHVVANGEGKVSAAPDRATVTLTAQVHHADAGVAKQSVDRSVNALLALAPTFALGTGDISAADLSLSEVNDTDEHGRRTSNGFDASREVTIKLHDLGRLGAFLDAAVAAGLTRIDNVEFSSSHADALRQQARANAAADARSKASDLARGFGATLGPVYSIDSVSSDRGHSYGGRTNLDRIEVTGSRINNGRYIQPTVQYSEQVSVVFELRRP